MGRGDGRNVMRCENCHEKFVNAKGWCILCGHNNKKGAK